MAKTKKASITINHITTPALINNSTICKNCPMRIYTDIKDTVKLGVGNMYSNYIFIVPAYDVKADIKYTTILNILQEEYKKLTGKNLFEEIYITRTVKCYERANYEMFDTAINNCISFLYYELSKVKARNLVFFGNTYEKLIGDNKISPTFLTNKVIHKTYSPAIMFYDNDKLKQTFIEQLNNIINYDIV